MLALPWDAAAQGFAVNIALIMIVGPQNLLVVRQALLGGPLLATVGICLAVDAALIVVGVTALGAVVTATPWLAHTIPWAAVIFLMIYAARAWRSAAMPAGQGFAARDGQGAGLSAAIAAFGVSALNPQAYMDSAVIMGGWAAPLPVEARVLFCAGAVLASAIWFFGLGFAAARLSPWLRRPGSARTLDRTAAVSLAALSATLVWHQIP